MADLASLAYNPNDTEVLLGKAFAPFASSVGPGFWQVIYDKLLDDGADNKNTPKQVSGGDCTVTDLNLAVIPIWGYFGPSTFYPQQSIFSIDSTSFNEQPTTNPNQYASKGKLVIVDSYDNFKAIDKNAFIAKHIASWDQVESDPAQLVTFVILCYPDLKSYSFTYWFGFPATSSIEFSYEPATPFTKVNIAQDFVKAYESNQDLIQKSSGFFAYDVKRKELKTLSQVGDSSINDIEYCLVDPSGCSGVPGWPIRNYAAYILRRKKISSRSKFKILSIRPDKKELCSRSCEFTFIPEFSTDWEENPKVLGWEQTNGKFIPKVVDLKSNLDPVTLSKTTVDFNLKLMKWRLFPEFDLDKMHDLKVCLIGAGTLGCNVARALMGWGVRNISIVDNGKVSYSNPVRQSLYRYTDCGEPKAAAAAKNLEVIFPGVQAKGYRLFIPMPGHPPISLESTKKDFSKFEEIVKASDVLFLLTDTRESRWLPTVLGVVHNKLVINAALGFDSYMVMRHGRQGEDLGCYFCTDIVVPGNSMVDRTLDQQCTVSRPGVSMIAGALAVELMTTVLYDEGQSQNEQMGSSTLGAPAHSHRGFLSSGQYIAPTFQRFDKCSACSQKVVDKFKDSGVEFVLEVMRDPTVLEVVAGLDKLAFGTEDIVELSDESDD